LQSIYVSANRGGGYELRCETCYESARAWQIVGWVFTGIIVLIMVIFFLGRH
jgi:hypothetical protein